PLRMLLISGHHKKLIGSRKESLGHPADERPSIKLQEGLLHTQAMAVSSCQDYSGSHSFQPFSWQSSSRALSRAFWGLENIFSLFNITCSWLIEAVLSAASWKIFRIRASSTRPLA